MLHSQGTQRVAHCNNVDPIVDCIGSLVFDVHTYRFVGDVGFQRIVSLPAVTGINLVDDNEAFLGNPIGEFRLHYGFFRRVRNVVIADQFSENIRTERGFTDTPALRSPEAIHIPCALLASQSVLRTSA